MKTELIFLGAPASGKGTQTKKLSRHLDLPHIDTGSMLRAEIAAGTEDGKRAKFNIDKGQLVPLDIVKTIIQKRLVMSDCAKGFILDGYPRSLEQAVALEEILEIANKGEKTDIKVINIDVDEDILVDRIINRRMCKDCGKIYNMKYYPPKDNDKCDMCRAELVQRDDDTEEIAIKRIETYKNQTQPLIKFYSDKNLLVNIDGNKLIDEIFSDIVNIVRVNQND